MKLLGSVINDSSCCVHFNRIHKVFFFGSSCSHFNQPLNIAIPTPLLFIFFFLVHLLWLMPDWLARILSIIGDGIRCYLGSISHVGWTSLCALVAIIVIHCSVWLVPALVDPVSVWFSPQICFQCLLQLQINFPVSCKFVVQRTTLYMPMLMQTFFAREYCIGIIFEVAKCF